MEDLSSILGEARGPTSSGWFQYNCPLCAENGKTEDIKFHLGVHPGHGRYNCVRCDSRGRLDHLLRKLGADSKVIKGSLDALRDQIVSNFAVETPVMEEILYPENFYPWDHPYGMQAFSYLLSRGIPANEIPSYRVGYCTDGKYGGRVIFPVFDFFGKLVFWQGRLIDNVKGAQRYMTPPGGPRKHVLFNLTNAVKYDSVIVTEGPISAMAAGVNAVCSFGKQVTQEQISALAVFPFSTYFVALDGDDIAVGIKVANALYAKQCNVRFAFLPKPKEEKDPAALGRDRFYKILNEAPVYTPDMSHEYLLRDRMRAYR